jgi:hypothetical protein
MRNMGMLIPIAFIVIISRVVSAETWKAYTVLDEEKSKSWRELEGATFGQRGLCTKVPIRYTLELADNTFTATSSFGKMFSIPVPEDGVIKKSYKRAGLTKPDMGCYFKLTPESSPPPPLPWSRPAGMSEADYCRALTQTYETYVTGSTSVSSTHIPNTVDGNVAVLQCEAGNTAAGIPVLERKLRDAKIDLPARG